MDDRDTGNAVLANLCALNQWANLTLIDACADLEDAQLDRALPAKADTLRHALWDLIEREHRMVMALDGRVLAEDDRLPGAPDGGLGTLRVHAIDSGEALTAWAEAVAGDPLIDREHDGTVLHLPASILVGDALLQAAGQRRSVLEALHSLGVTPPDISANAWWSTLRSVGSEGATI